MWIRVSGVAFSGSLVSATPCLPCCAGYTAALWAVPGSALRGCSKWARLIPAVVKQCGMLSRVECHVFKNKGVNLELRAVRRSSPWGHSGRLGGELVSPGP